MNNPTDEHGVISSSSFYGEYHGHPIGDLEVLDKHLRSKGKSIIYLAGDSSADNKYWFSQQGRALNGYEAVLRPPTSTRDVAYNINAELVERSLGERFACINCAVEESKVASRDAGCLLPQDQFIRDHIQPDDMLVVSVGGNDIALATSPCTIASMLSLICCSTTSCISRCSCGCHIPFVCDPFCCGGSCIGCLSNCCACPQGLGYFIHLFKTKIENYLLNLVKIKKPKVIGVCMIYYPSEAAGGWADRVLGVLGYDEDPAKLQTLIRTIFEMATSRIVIPGVRVVGIPLFEVLDGKSEADYEQRVEPSSSGGEKMAKFILKRVLASEGEEGYQASAGGEEGDAATKIHKPTAAADMGLRNRT
jgi:hypothetical protein